MVDFSWDATVDLVRIRPDFQRTEERMTMRSAVDCWLQLSDTARRCVSIKPLEPYAAGESIRPIIIATLSFLEIERLTKRSDFLQS